jgi:hypothetical protein
VHVAAGAEVAALPAQYHGLDVVGIGQIAEQVAQFGVGVEGQRVLAFGTVERDQCHAAFHAIAEVPRLVGFEFLPVARQLVRFARKVFHCSILR